MSLSGRYFDGRTSDFYDMELDLDEQGMVSPDSDAFEPISLKELNITSRVGNIKRSIYFPSGAVFETTDNDTLDVWQRRVSGHVGWAYRLESRLGYVLGSLVFLVTFVIVSAVWGVPWFSKVMAEILPSEASVMLADGAMESMDRLVFSTSELSEQRKQELRSRFRNLLPENKEGFDYSLHFRKSGMIGANAFALPDGKIVITDGLVELAGRDEEIVSVLLHEIGHVVHRHSLRHIISHSGLAVIAATLTGDLSSAGGLVIAMPSILMESSYSRDFEWEADGYALSEMKRRGIATNHFANFMERLAWEELLEIEEEEGLNEDWMDYLSTHPPNEKRIARFRTSDYKENNDLSRPELIAVSEPADVPDVFELRGLLEDGEYEHLHDMLAGYQTAYEDGEGRETAVDAAFSAFGTAIPEYENYLDDWIKHMPEAYTARLARGYYYYDLSWVKRGHNYIQDTSSGQIVGMQKAQDRAIEDLKKALELNGRLTVAYKALAGIAATRGEDERKQGYFNKGLEIDQSSYVLRNYTLNFLLPRWGGSHAEIRMFIDDTEKYIDINPALAPLEGYLYHARAMQAYSDKQYRNTIILENAAIKRGNKALYYDKRGKAYYRMEDYESALTDYTNAINLNKYDHDLYLWRSYIYEKLNKAEKRLQDLEYAARLNPYDYGVRKDMGDALLSEERFEGAVASFRAALRYRPDDDYLWFRTGWYEFKKLDNPEAARESMENATRLAPENAKYWYNYASVLNKLKDCRIMAAMDKYLALCPSAEGCFEEGTKWINKQRKLLKRAHCK